MFCRPCESETPAMPSSPHRKARERAMSCVKSVDGQMEFMAWWERDIRLHASPSGLEGRVSTTHKTNGGEIAYE
jgi:hypothetical protein